jgi:hypothetical protein
MMAINHAVGGAIIGAAVSNPLLAVPLAFASHFALDAIPHYEPVAGSKADSISSKKFFREQILINGLLCFGLVLALAITQPKNWLLIAVCAFAGASPDFMWLPRFLHTRKTGRDLPSTNPLLRFHSRIQWWTSPKLLGVELVWLVATGALLAVLL